MKKATEIEINIQRANVMKSMYDNGLTYQEIGEQYGLTKQRVSQIFQQFAFSARPKEKNNRKL